MLVRTLAVHIFRDIHGKLILIQSFIVSYHSKFQGLLYLQNSPIGGSGFRVERSGVRIPTMPLFYWVATLGKLFTHIASQSSQLQETGVQKGVPVFELDRFNG